MDVPFIEAAIMIGTEHRKIGRGTLAVAIDTTPANALRVKRCPVEGDGSVVTS